MTFLGHRLNSFVFYGSRGGIIKFWMENVYFPTLETQFLKHFEGENLLGQPSKFNTGYNSFVSGLCNLDDRHTNSYRLYFKLYCKVLKMRKELAYSVLNFV